MKSKEQIKSELEQIADSHDLTGEALDLIIDLLTYSLYHEQVEISNTAKEMSLNDAVLINSKISLCCNNMYSVYRGKNPRVNLKVRLSSTLSKDKFDKLYESNSFKVYAANAFSYNSSVNDERYVEGIISKNEIIDRNFPITKDDLYYLDLKDSETNRLFSDLSEDIIVSIVDTDGEYREYKTTRIFSDHCKSVGDDEMIFVLTIPDYGIRLFKKNKFNKGDIVNVKVIRYTTLDDINESELNKITIPGTQTLAYDDENPNVKYELIDPIPRQNVDSLLYEVNLAGRVNHEIQSNSDVAYLFNEVFIDKIIASSYKYVADPDTRLNDKLYIKYIPRTSTVHSDITPSDIEFFKSNYCSYFICETIDISKATEIPVTMVVEVITDDTTQIHEEVQIILNEFNYKLGIELNKELLVSKISKLTHVKYVKSLKFEFDPSYDETSDDNYDKYYVITPELMFLLS